MLATVYQTMITLSEDTETKLTDLLGDMFKTNYYRGCYDVQSVLGIGFNVSKVDVKMLQRILQSIRGLERIIRKHCGKIQINLPLLPRGS
ncbi:MAG: hypothetical protein ACLVCH_04200 [Roseburia inulinivorans]